MSNFEWDASSMFSRLDLSGKKAQKVAEERLWDGIDDIARIATNIAPVKSGTLRKDIKKTVKGRAGSLVGEITFTAIESSSGYGRFNYALWTHEFMTSLGPLSSSAGGSDGYPVGSKYLSRPLEGERDRILRQIAEGVKGALD
ncbi:hypothetical protein [Shouchella patagoniensis]|uniref:hypothetical protein n=1 Tax=Shouchella patagoniensis TaxID=228576 RepID=UPI0009955192|nr:hypothetical protein [Shouchella patagoniensis]